MTWTLHPSNIKQLQHTLRLIEDPVPPIDVDNTYAAGYLAGIDRASALIDQMATAAAIVHAERAEPSPTPPRDWTVEIGATMVAVYTPDGGRYHVPRDEASPLADCLLWAAEFIG